MSLGLRRLLRRRPDGLAVQLALIMAVVYPVAYPVLLACGWVGVQIARLFGAAVTW